MNKYFILSDALDYIESGLKSEMTQQEIADHCRCSLSSLQKMFRYTFHIGVSDYVTRRRLTCCARELISTNRSAYLIAFDIKHLTPINEVSTKDGDIAIRDSLKRIEEAAEEDMLLFRIGGDEFVLATGRTDPAAAEAIMGKVLSRNGEAFEWEGRQFPLSLHAVKFLIPDRTIRYGELFSEIAQALDSVK